MFEVTADDGPGVAANEASHVYEELPSNYFRLLRVLPGDLANEVLCEISQYDLRERIKYTALSYT